MGSCHKPLSMVSGVQKTSTYDTHPIVYDTFNTSLPGPTLVFIHGFTCSSALWPGQAPLLQTHRAITIDLPGHGRSPAPHIDYTMEFFAEAVATVLTSEETTSAVLIGHSMGGPVATMTLRLCPHLVAAIVYVDSFFELPESFLSLAERRALAAKRADDEYFAGFLESFWSGRTTEDVKEQVRRTMLETNRWVRTHTCATDVQPHAWKADEVYDVPALAISCPMFGVDGRWERHVKALEVRVWEGNGHFLHMEDAERFNAEVESWLREKGLVGGK